MIQKMKIILVVLILFNIIIASFLVLDFRVFTPPKTRVHIQINEVNADEIIIQTTVTIDNNNNFDLIVSDFFIRSTSKAGVEIGQILISGGIVESKQNKTFHSVDSFILKDQAISIIESTLTALVGFRFFGLFEKTLPLEIDIITSLDAVFDQIQQPTINMQADIVEVNEQGLLFSTTLDLYNPTDLSYFIDDVTLVFEDQNKSLLGTIVFENKIIKPRKSIQMYSEALLIFDALDAETIFLTLDAVAGVQIASLMARLPISANLSINVPDIKELIFGNTPIDFILNADFKLTVRGINCCFGFQLYNPSNITIIAQNLVCSVLALNQDTYVLLGENIMQSCTALPGNEGCVQTNITIPYIHFLRSIPRKIRPDFIVLKIEGDLSIAGTRQSVPISLNAYISPYLVFN
jgi:LEA14-like dessication related protein